MASQSVVTISPVFSGDVGDLPVGPFAAAANANSPAQTDIVTLSSGANTITVPSGGTVPTGVTIVPPSVNTNTITLKGVTGDTGVGLSPTNPTFISLAPSVTTFVLTASAQIQGVRLVWS